MNYIIHTPSPARLKKEILDRVSEKGCIVLKQVPGRNVLQVRFHYWDSCKEQSIDDDKIMLGRFTELLLVHFSYFVDKIVIE